MRIYFYGNKKIPTFVGFFVWRNVGRFLKGDYYEKIYIIYNVNWIWFWTDNIFRKR